MRTLFYFLISLTFSVNALADRCDRYQQDERDACNYGLSIVSSVYTLHSGQPDLAETQLSEGCRGQFSQNSGLIQICSREAVFHFRQHLNPNVIDISEHPELKDRYLQRYNNLNRTR